MKKVTGLLERKPSNWPWLDRDGSLFADQALRRIGRYWSTETWEQFLLSTVERPVRREEALLESYGSRLEEQVETPWEFYGPLPERVEEEVRFSIKTLDKNNKKIIFGYYWLDISLRKLGKILGTNQVWVLRKKASALLQIRSKLASSCNTATYLIGGSNKLTTHPERSRDQQIADVYRKDLNGSFMK